MFQRIRRYFIQGALDKTDDIFERGQIESVFNLNIGFFILYSLMLIHFSTLDTSFAFDLTNILSWIWSASIIFVIRWTKSSFWPGVGFVVMGIWVSTTMIFLSSGVPSVETGVWHSFGVLTAFLFLGLRWGLVVSLYYIVITILMVVSKHGDFGWFEAGLSMGRSELGDDPVAVAIPMAAALYMLGHFLQTRMRAQKLIGEQKIAVEEQHKLLEVKNEEITSSITYAKRIQEAILPAKRLISEVLPNSFLLYKPKDIVAGDFYWMEKANGKILIAAADCTGHGVPGAMVSVVCHNALNRAVREFKLSRPSEILDKTQELVMETFQQSEKDVKDGMDIGLISVDKVSKRIEYSGAHNSMYLVHDGEIQTVEADKQPIGKYEKREPFTNHAIQFELGDVVYLYTDGFPDQFGGPKGKKFKYSRFKDLLVKVSVMEMPAQKAEMDKVFEEWRGGLEQLDDVCVIGVKI